MGYGGFDCRWKAGCNPNSFDVAMAYVVKCPTDHNERRLWPEFREKISKSGPCAQPLTLLASRGWARRRDESMTSQGHGP
ncbi:hypothetical protein K443DRAFT_595266 [Laccaria amethystina LaAM-08-1]|uniref:Uncharacterized protein n=1 Tax=Laccaria amethystina LaAM-08-1 TaxID=1095629 RepID=A0A0C9XST5_9AGAR|nr:hypothetical protein K443DRAFT_595266 [Laccaria amethystina LaAM-08-1]